MSIPGLYVFLVIGLLLQSLQILLTLLSKSRIPNVHNETTNHYYCCCYADEDDGEEDEIEPDVIPDERPVLPTDMRLAN